MRPHVQARRDDGRISEAEHALLGFIKANSPRIDPALDKLMATVA